MKKCLFLSCLLIAISCQLYAGERGFRLYKSDTSSDYTFGSGNEVAFTSRWQRKLTYINPTQGTWYFVLRAWAGDLESISSNEVSADLDADESVTFGWDEFFWYYQRLVFSLDNVGQITGGGAGSIKLEK